MKTTKKLLAVVLAVMMVVAMVPATVAFAAENEISTTAELQAACEAGGEYTLTADVVAASYTVTKSLTINGGDHKITYGKSLLGRPIFKVAADGVVLTINNTVLDGNKKGTAVNTEDSGNDNANVKVVLNDCTVQNCKALQYFGAVKLFSHAQGEFNNCTFTNNSCVSKDEYSAGADIWAGAATTVTINGGSYNQVFLNSNSTVSAQATVSGGATVAELAVESEAGTQAVEVTVDDTSSVESITSNAPAGTATNVTLNVSADKVIDTLDELKAAATNGGTYYLGANIDVTEQVNVENDLTLVGCGYTLKSTAAVKTIKLANNDAAFTANDVVFDGNSVGIRAVETTTNQSSLNNENNVVTLSGCTVKNYVGSNYTGAVYLFSRSQGNFTDCTFEGNTTPQTPYYAGSDIWAGSATKVNISGGTYAGEVFANAQKGGSGAVMTIDGAEINEVIVEQEEAGAVAASVTINNSTVSSVLLPQGDTETCTIVDSVVNVVDNSGTALMTAITTEDELIAAAANGGTYVLGANIEVDGWLMVEKDLKLIGNGYKITAKKENKWADPFMFSLNNNNAKFEAEDVIFDGNKTAATAVSAYQKVPNEGNIITLTDCTVKNFIGFSYVGAVYLYSRSTGNFNNCKFTNNTTQDTENFASGSDIWAGAASTVNINGGSFSKEIYLNCNSGVASKATIQNATVAELTVADDVYVPTVTISNSTVKKLLTCGNEDTSNITITDSTITTQYSEGVESKDGSKFIYIDETQKVASADTNHFGLTQSTYKNLELLGVQTKAAKDEALRFISVINSDIIKSADDYGYIIGTTSKAKADAMAAADQITVDNAKNYMVSCMGTSNQVSGDYGVYDTDTSYKYITAAVEGITDTSKVIFARVYVTKNGKTYYGDYINGTTYGGCATSFAELG